MARTVLREFTGGLSNEIDPQNLRNDQGEESLDINLKGFALEPGEGTAPISGGHYYYRGEWITDSKAISFEESGIGVVKTYNEKRPEFEEIIKDDVNVFRSLGPPLPPTAVISGTVVSEGTRGERPAEGTHLLKVPETALGELDKVVGSTPAASLETYEEDPTTLIDDIHYYNGQAYWIVKPAGTPSNWTVKTRGWSSELGEFTSSDVTSTVMPHNSGGSFFKDGYFVCWDNQYIDSVVLSYTSMSGVDTINTVDPNDNGDAGAQGFGDNAGGDFTSGASSTEITGVNIDANGLITFSQRITTANTVPTAYESSTISGITNVDSADERWLRTPSDTSKRGCFLVLMRDGLAETDSDAHVEGSGVVTDATIPVPSVFTTKIGATEADRNIFPSGGWITASATITTQSGGQYAHIRASDMVVPDFGIRYAVMFVENDSWIRVRYNDPVDKPPEMFIMNYALSQGGKGGKEAAEAVTCSAYMTSKRVNKASPGYTWYQRQAYSHKEWSAGSFFTGGFNTSIYSHWGELYRSYQDTINICLNFPTLPSSGNKIHWKYNAPQGDKLNQSFGGLHNVPSLDASSARMWICPGVYGKTWLSVNAFAWAETDRLFLFAIPGIKAGTPGSLAVVDDVATPTKNVGIWTRSLGKIGSNTQQTWSQKTSKSKFRNNITSSPVPVPGKMNRLCSYVRGGATTQRGAFSVSELWTTARFASADNSLAFAEAKAVNFRVGDYIKIGQNGTNKSMHLNLRGDAKGSDSRNTIGEQTFITAKILEIVEGSKLLLSPPEIDHSPGKVKKYIDEDCYPVISGFIDYSVSKKKTTDKPAGGPVCSVIQSDLLSHVLVGHGNGRTFNAIPYDYAKYGTRDLIEVREAGGVEVPSTELKEQCHRVSWTGRDYRWIGGSRVAVPHEVRGAGSVTAPRIYYTKGGKLYSQAGLAGDTAPKPVALSLGGGYHVDENYLTHFDNQGVTIYSPDLLSTHFVKANPTLSDGLGLTGNVTDARTFVDSYNAVYVCVKIAGYWKLVKTSAYGPESSLLSYDFKKPIGFDGTKIWGIDSASAGGWDIQYATPFYESSIIGSYIFFANSYTTVTPTETAWGQVVNSRIGEKGDKGTPRYLSVDWKMDSGTYFGTGDPTIGLNHEANKMIVENTFKWYPLDAPINYTTAGTGTVIANIPNVVNTYKPLASIEISFKSRVYRDIVFFKQSETMLPTGGETGGENKISFLNYTDASQSFYVLNDNSFKIVTQYGKEPEDAYRLGQATTGSTVFDASKVGISSFLIGAPNMFNAYGANIDLYYRASFINKWGHESVPSPLPSKGITALDSADDCVQVNFNAPFFRFDDTNIDTIRLYRYGGDSSEFLFLKDIPMPTLPVDSVTGNKYFPTISGINSITNGFLRKSAISPYYLLKTHKDINSLSGFTNSNFLLTATPSSLDGSWRVNQVSENDSPTVTYTTTLKEDLNKTDTTVKLTNAANPSAWPTTGVIKLGTEYISYAAISSNDLTGCVRGVHDTNASDHESGHVKTITVTAGGTNYGFDDGSGGFSSADRSGESFSNPTNSNRLLLDVPYGTNPVNGVVVLLKTDGVLPTVLSLTSTYYVTNTDNDFFELATTTTVTSGTFTATNPGNVITLTSVGHPLAIDDVVTCTTTGTFPTGILAGVFYYVRYVSGDDFRLSAFVAGGTASGSGLGSGTMTWTKSNAIRADITGGYGTDIGSGTPSFNGCVITGTGGGGTGFISEYAVNTSTGAITSVSIFEGGEGYSTVPTLVINDPGPANAGSGETIAITLDSGKSPNVVEWILEMEHRNQDTTTLTEAISTALTGTANVINVTDTTVFPAASASGSPGPKKILIGNEILTYTDKTNTTFTGVTPATEGTIASTHGLNVLVRSYDETFATTTVTNASIEIEGFGFRDKARTPISSLYSMGLDNYPPLGLEYNVEKKQFFETESEDDYFRYIKAVGSMYFGSLDANLRFSKYGTPEYWPIDAVVTLDSEIRCIEEHAGEGLIFTTNSLYRVRGTDPKAMVAFRVPDARGLPAGYEHTVSDFNGGLIWLTASDGVAMYQSGRVTYLTRDKHNIGRLKAPYSCVVDGAYWLFQEPGSGGGYRLELATGEMRLAQTTIEAYYAYFAKPLGVGVVVTKDNTINPDRDSEFLVEEIGGTKASNIEWRSKKIDAGEPAIPKALGSVAIVYEALNSTNGETIVGGIRGQALAAELLGLDPEDLDAGDIATAELETSSNLYSIFTKYDEPNQEFTVDIGGGNLTSTERRTIGMPIGFDTSSVTVGDRVWNELLADNTSVESVGRGFVSNITNTVVASDGSSDLLFTDTDHTLLDGDEIQFTTTGTLPGNITTDTNYYVIEKTGTTFKVETVVGGANVQYSSTLGSGVSYGRTNPIIVLDKEPLRSGEGTIYWGNLPMVEVYLNNDDTPSRVFTLPPGDVVEPQSMDLYLNDLKRFRTISVGIKGDVRVQSLSLRHYPLQRYQSSTLHHSADIFYKGDIDFRVMLDGSLVYRKELSNAGDDFKEERIYLPASSFGQRAHYMNESRAGMIESVKFNGSVAA